MLRILRFGYQACGCSLVSLLLSCSSPTVEVASKPVEEASKSVEDVWDVIYMQGAKVGYSHTVTDQIERDGRDLLHTRSENQLEFRRFGKAIEQHVVLESTESLDGGLVGFRSELSSGPTPMVTTGHYEEGQLLIRTDSESKTQRSTIPWAQDWLGFFAAEQSLQREPLQPGQVRKFRALMPVFNQPADVILEAIGYEPTELLTGTHTLLKIRSLVSFGGPIGQIESFSWTDRTGQTLKTLVPGVGQTGYRTTREMALGKSEGPAFDLGDFATIRVESELLRPHETTQVTYRVRMQDGDPSSVLADGLTQSVTALDEHSAEVVVRAVRPNLPKENTARFVTEPTDDDLAPNNLIQSDDERIVALAGEDAAGEFDAWTIARQLELLVQRRIEVKDFSQAFATAAEVAESMEGDCTEHSVLLAALCRARNIPARVTMGLVYYQQEGGYAYHMWNEVWIRDRWVPLDATLGLGGIGAAHLKLADSNLAGAGAYSAFLPVFHVLGRLEIEILDVQR